MKKIFMALIILSLVGCVMSRGQAGMFQMQRMDGSSFTACAHRLERLYTDAEKISMKYLQAEDPAVNTEKWNKYFSRWNDELYAVRDEAVRLGAGQPLIKDYFTIAVRNLALVYRSYEQVFAAEVTGFDRVKENSRAFLESLRDIEKEIEFIDSKHTSGARPGLYQ